MLSSAIAYRLSIAVVSHPTIFMTAGRDTPARSRFRVADRLKSWGIRPSSPASVTASFQPFRKYVETLTRESRRLRFYLDDTIKQGVGAGPGA